VAVYQSSDGPVVLRGGYPALPADATGYLDMPAPSFSSVRLEDDEVRERFAISGTYRDRSQRNKYPIITSWEDENRDERVSDSEGAEPDSGAKGWALDPGPYWRDIWRDVWPR
jgi:hypothetical protein